MTHYTRFWNCERCDKRMESIDYPKVEVCDKCIGADIVVTRELDPHRSLMRDIASRAYERGFVHGKAVADAKNQKEE